MIAQQARVGMAGLIGLDMPACLDVLEALGVSRSVAAQLLPYAEMGLLKATKEG